MMKIDKITIDTLNDCSISCIRMSEKLQWYERKYQEDPADIKHLIEWVETIYDKTDGNSPIKSISTKEVPVFLDDKDEPKSTFVEIKREELESYIRELQNEIDKLKKEKEQEQNQELIGDLNNRIDDLETGRDKLKKLLGQKTILIEKKYTRLGYYTRNGKSHNPEIVLLMGAIGDDKQRLISTYVHEMFHAYYDLCWIKGQNNPKYKKQVDLTYIEEPLTEYAMLKFLEAFGYEDVLEVAQGVRRKQFSPGTCHYGFGYYLWKWEKDNPDWHFDWIKCYRDAKFEIRDSKDKSKFEYPFSKGLYPFGKEYESMELLYKILTKIKSKHSCNVSTGGSIIINNPWMNLAELNKNDGTKVAKTDRDWLRKLSPVTVFKDLKLNLFPEPYIGHPDAQIYFLNGNPGYHDDDVYFVEKDNYFPDAIKKTLKHAYRNSNCGDFLYLDNNLDKGFKKHPGYRWWTRHLKSFKEAINKGCSDPNSFRCPKVFNLEFFPYHSKDLDELKKYFESKIKESKRNCSDWQPDWPSFEYTRYLVKKAIEEKKIIVVMRLKKYWYSAIPDLKFYPNVIELKDSQSVYITEDNVQFRVVAEALCKATWGTLVSRA